MTRYDPPDRDTFEAQRRSEYEQWCAEQMDEDEINQLLSEAENDD